MKKIKPDIQADIFPQDRGESLSLMEPLFISENSSSRPDLIDLVMELVAKSSSFKSSLPTPIRTSLAALVRSMNCYYSNLIEGHNTHPIDIERALQGNFSNDVKKRNLQEEAKAHILVQEWIENGGLKNKVFSEQAIFEIHYKFCKLLPEALLWVENPYTKQRIQVIPGQLRTTDVEVAEKG